MAIDEVAFMIYEGISRDFEDYAKTKWGTFYLWEGLASELQNNSGDGNAPEPEPTPQPNRLNKRARAETSTPTSSAAAPANEPKRRKVQNSVDDLREQVRKKGFRPEDTQLFDQPHYGLSKRLDRYSEISAICELGAETPLWTKNTRKMSISNVEDKLVHRRKHTTLPDAISSVPQNKQLTDNNAYSSEDEEADSDDEENNGEEGSDEEDSDSQDEEPEEERVVVMQGTTSHLYRTGPPPPPPPGPSTNTTGGGSKINADTRAEAPVVMQLAKQNLNQTVNRILSSSDTKINIMVKHMLSRTQPRKGYSVRVIIEDKLTGQRRYVIRSVPYYLNSLKAAAVLEEGGGGGGTGGVHPEVHLHLREWEEAWLLRSPIHEWGERSCINGKQCQGYAYCFDTKTELREYVSPKEHCYWMTFGKWPHLSQTERQCLLCKRHSISKGYWSSRAARRAANPSNFLLAEFYNLVNVPGEYHIGQCLWNQGPYMGLWGPVAVHHLPNYSTSCTTLGDMIAQGRITPSSALQSHMSMATMQQIPIVLYRQTGFIQVEKAGSHHQHHQQQQQQDFCRGLPQ